MLGKNIKKILFIGFVSIIPFLFVSCTTLEEDLNMCADIFNKIDSSISSLINIEKEKEKEKNTEPIVKFDLGNDGKETNYLYYIKDNEKICLLQTMGPEGIYSYNDYYISVEVFNRYSEKEIYKLVLVNKYTAEKKYFDIKDKALFIRMLDKNSGNVVLDVGSGEFYCFNIDKESFTKLSELEFFNMTESLNNNKYMQKDNLKELIQIETNTSYQTVFYEDNSRLTLLANIPIDFKIYEYNDYLISLQINDILIDELNQKYTLFLINKFSLDKEMFYLDDEDISNIIELDELNGILTLKTLSNSYYIFDINSKTFTKK